MLWTWMAEKERFEGGETLRGEKGSRRRLFRFCKLSLTKIDFEFPSSLARHIILGLI